MDLGIDAYTDILERAHEREEGNIVKYSICGESQ